MKTYAQYQQDSFIENLDDANAKLNLLEAQAGKPQSEFIACINTVNRRIYEAQNNATPAAAPKATAPGGDEMKALQARQRSLCAALGLDPKFQGTCNTVAEYRTQITKLEARLTETTKPKVEEKPKPAQPFNATLGFYRTGKAKGIAKAMGAAVEKAQR